MPALSKLLHKLNPRDHGDRDGHESARTHEAAPIALAAPAPAPRDPVTPEPVTTYFLSSPSTTASPSGSGSSLTQVPSNTLIFGFTRPPPSHPSTPQVDFFLKCLPDPIGFLETSAYFIRSLLSSPAGSPDTSLEQGMGELRLENGNPNGDIEGHGKRKEQWRHQYLHLMLKDEGGLAYTTDGKITVSLQWVGHVAGEVERGMRDLKGAEKEFKGVLLHELVHTIQYDGDHTLPGWLVESIADYVRLHAGLDPPHWRKPGQGRREKGWEDAYDAGARFLDWIVGASAASRTPLANEVSGQSPASAASASASASATQYPAGPIPSDPPPPQHPLPPPGPGKKRRPPLPDFVRLLNARLASEKFKDGWWKEMCRDPLEVLWEEYLDYYGVS